MAGSVVKPKNGTGTHPQARTSAHALRLEVYGALLTLFSLVLLLALATSDRLDVTVGAGEKALNFLGPVGAHMADVFLWALGLVAFPLTLVLGLLGVRAVIAKSLERIHTANLINVGILPLTFVNPADYDRIAAGDELLLAGARAEIEAGKNRLMLVNTTRKIEIPLAVSLTERQQKILLAGGLLNTEH